MPTVGTGTSIHQNQGDGSLQTTPSGTLAQQVAAAAQNADAGTIAAATAALKPVVYDSLTGLDLKEVDKQVKSWINAELSAFFARTDSQPLSQIAKLPLEEGDRKFLLEVRQQLSSESTQALTDHSIRNKIFSGLGIEALDRYDNLLLKAHSHSACGEILQAMPPNKRAEFAEAEKTAAKVFLAIVDGRRFSRIELSPFEAEIVDLNAGLRRQQPDADLSLISQRAEVIHSNFIQRIAFKIVKGEFAFSENKGPFFAPPSRAAGRFADVSVDWRTLHRASAVEAFGDLNGSYQGLVDHLFARELIAEKNQCTWTGGDKRLVVIGDILGDRNANGLQTIEAISRINKEAVAHGGSVDCLAGNHDGWFNSVFGVGGTGPEIFQYAGTLESAFYLDETFKQYVIARFDAQFENNLTGLQQAYERVSLSLKAQPQPLDAKGKYFEAYVKDLASMISEIRDIYSSITPEDETRFFAMLKYLNNSDKMQIGLALQSRKDEVLEKMRADPNGRKRLEAICEQKVAVFHDDTLFVHTNMSQKVALQLLTARTMKDTVDAKNMLYQKALRHYLLNEGQLTEDEVNEFREIRHAFLSSQEESRVNFTEDFSLSDADKELYLYHFKARGVNLIVHGHNDENGEIKGNAELPIVSIDRSVYKFEDSKGRNEPIATMTIGVSGEARSAEANQMVRAL